VARRSDRRESGAGGPLIHSSYTTRGDTIGQTNKLKTLKRAMYGLAGIDLLRARTLPLDDESLHRE
jgi:hypothetical protein